MAIPWNQKQKCSKIKQYVHEAQEPEYRKTKQQKITNLMDFHNIQ